MIQTIKIIKRIKTTEERINNPIQKSNEAPAPKANQQRAKR